MRRSSSPPIELGGRRFRAVDIMTVAHDAFFIARCRFAGLDAIPMIEGETAEQYAVRLLTTLMGSPTVLEIVGALVVPEALEDSAWTPQMASDTAAFVGSLTGDVDKAQVRFILLSVLVPFLQRGLGYLTVSRASSGAPESSASRLPDVNRGPAMSSGNGAT
jgi:hypothetical protein